MNSIEGMEVGQRVVCIDADVPHGMDSAERTPLGQIGVYAGPYGPGTTAGQPILVVLDDKSRALAIRDDGSWVIKEWAYARPEVGQKVTITRIRGAESRNGAVDTVRDAGIESDESGTFYTSGGWSVSHGEWEPIVEEQEAIVEQPDVESIRAENQALKATISEQEETIASMRADVETATAAATASDRRARTIDEEFRQSMAIISERLIEECNLRDWCSEYDRIIAEINERLPNYELQARKRLIPVPVRVRGVVYRDIDVWVEAVDEDDARDLAEDSDNWLDSDGDSFREDADEVVRGELRRHGWDEFSIVPQ